MHEVKVLPNTMEDGASLVVQLFSSHRVAGPHLHSGLGMVLQLGEICDNAMHPTVVKIRI